MNGIQINSHFTSRMGERTLSVRQTTAIIWLSQACQQPITRPVLWVTQADTSCGRPRATCGDRINRLASTIHGRNYKNRQTRQTSLQLTWTYHRHNSSFRASSSKTYYKQIKKKAQFIQLFPKDRMQTFEITKAPWKRKLDDRADGLKFAGRFGDMTTADHKACE